MAERTVLKTISVQLCESPERPGVVLVNVEVPAGMLIEEAEMYLHRAAEWCRRVLIAMEVGRMLEAREQQHRRIIAPDGGRVRP